ncbi:MAG TPA: hypothetical protein VFS24_06495 [Steroidobacteraceae bacterium]|nr:hypothetical protein [Steroidobacteraceae bacterium]
MRTSASQNPAQPARLRHHKKLVRRSQVDDSNDSLGPQARREELHTLGTHEISRLLREWRRTLMH